MKRFFKSVLKRFNRKLVYVPKGTVWGSDLNEDIKTIIGMEFPVCFDIGANTGQTIVHFRSIFRAPLIFAFEPSPATFKILESISDKTQLNLFNVGMGEEEGVLPFYEYSASDLSSFLTPADSEESRFSKAVPNRVINVPVKTVDDILAESKLGHIDILKSDAQGYDLQVLKGAKAALMSGKVHCILVELNMIDLYSKQASATEVIEFLSSCGFRLVDLYNKERRLNYIHWCDGLFVNKSWKSN